METQMQELYHIISGDMTAMKRKMMTPYEKQINKVYNQANWGLREEQKKRSAQ